MDRRTVDIFPDGRMNTHNAARYIGLSEKCLAAHRCRGTGPRFLKRGRVFYFREDLDAWLAEGLRTSTARGAGAA